MVDNSLDQCWGIVSSTIGIMLAFLMKIMGVHFFYNLILIFET